MNTLYATVASLAVSEHLSSLKVDVGGDAFHLLLAERHDPAKLLGTPVTLVFKESEVMLIETPVPTSANVHPATITRIRPGNVLTEISLDYRGHPIKALIPTAAYAIDTLNVGDTIGWLVSPGEISLLRENHEH